MANSRSAMEADRAMFVIAVFLSLISVLFSATHPNDLNVLNIFINDLENPEILQWPVAGNGSDPCGPPTWNHIICTGNRVSQILVQGLNLRGHLPYNLNQLTMLTHLGFKDNQFRGPLPSFNGLDRLQRAYFGNNSFNSIPGDFLHGLRDLEVLALDHNNYNASEGWSFPDDLQNLIHLTNLTCRNCNLVGSLPHFLGNLSLLQSLKLSGNNLSGSIDPVTSMSFLSSLWLNGNRFTGAIPDSIGNLTLLKDVYLQYNRFTGLIPNTLVSMALDTLDLRNNKFMGPIPLFEATNVSYSSNQFCRATPGSDCSLEVMALIDFLGGLNYPLPLVSAWSGNDPCVVPWVGLTCDSNQKITEISLSSLNLTGTLSPSLAKLDSLTVIRLAGNNLRGPIPENWTGLKSLRLLDLSGNDISLPIPKFNETVKVVQHLSSKNSDKKHIIIIIALSTVIGVILLIPLCIYRNQIMACCQPVVNNNCPCLMPMFECLVAVFQWLMHCFG